MTKLLKNKTEMNKNKNNDPIKFDKNGGRAIFHHIHNYTALPIVNSNSLHFNGDRTKATTPHPGMKGEGEEEREGEREKEGGREVCERRE